MRLLLEMLDIRVSHSCAFMWSDMVIVCACDGRDLYIRVSGGFSLNYTSWAIPAIVRVYKLHVLLITIGIFCNCSQPLLCSCIACLRILCVCGL